MTGQEVVAGLELTGDMEGEVVALLRAEVFDGDAVGDELVDELGESVVLSRSLRATTVRCRRVVRLVPLQNQRLI